MYAEMEHADFDKLHHPTRNPRGQTYLNLTLDNRTQRKFWLKDWQLKDLLQEVQTVSDSCNIFRVSRHMLHLRFFL